MPSHHANTSFSVAYLLVMACQLPVWLCAGVLWGGLMIVLADFQPVGGLLRGLGWGAATWVVVGNLFAVGLAWRRSAQLAVTDRGRFRAALERVCAKLRLIVLAEEADAIVLGPKRALVRFQLQEVRILFTNGMATLTAPALSFGAFRRALRQSLAEASAGK